MNVIFKGHGKIINLSPNGADNTTKYKNYHTWLIIKCVFV